MKVIGMTEFKNYCAANPGNVYIYDTENVLVDLNSIPDELQSETLISLYAVRQTSYYNSVVTMLAPNIICFINQNGNQKSTLEFGLVKQIELEKGGCYDTIRIRVEYDPNKAYVILANHPYRAE